MSTEKRGRKKRRGLTIDRIKLIEYVSIGLVVLLFTGLALYYGTRTGSDAKSDALASPAPTEDTSIRGMNVLNALERGGYAVVPDRTGYDVTAPDGTRFRMELQSDDDGIVMLSFETELCADPEDDLSVSERLREKNRQTVDSLHDLFDRIMPVFHRNVSDSDTIVKQCKKVVSDGEPYSKHLGGYTVRIGSDPAIAPQTVTVTLIRDTN